MRNQGVQIGRHGGLVERVINCQVVHAVPALAQLACQLAHCCKDGKNFLRMMQHVIGFLAHLHQDVDHVIVCVPEPAVQRVELVAQDQPQRHCAGWHIGLYREFGGFLLRFFHGLFHSAR